jgi:hypothetical protein
VSELFSDDVRAVLQNKFFADNQLKTAVSEVYSTLAKFVMNGFGDKEVFHNNEFSFEEFFWRSRFSGYGCRVEAGVFEKKGIFSRLRRRVFLYDIDDISYFRGLTDEDRSLVEDLLIKSICWIELRAKEVKGFAVLDNERLESLDERIADVNAALIDLSHRPMEKAPVW